MSETNLPRAARLRRGVVEGVLGGAVTLVAITVAHASLPELVRTPLAAPARPSAPPVAAAPAPAPPPVLIAFRPPVPDGEVGSPFGLRQLPWEERARLHAGVDVVAPDPEPVLAAADGVVTRVGEDAGYGRFVEVTHAEGLTTLYGHLQRAEVRTGQALKAGAPLGQLGSTGSSTGVHLHFEIHDAKGQPLNPELFIGRAFATRAELPLREARRVPRHVRVAYVSRIPRSKRAQMEAKLAEARGLDAEEGAAPDITEKLAAASRAHGRVRVRLSL
ncbi:M23 family metallopeptidase [Phenylobacterium soli]|uniref:M23 family peptidase n=1 Tax=Phenylobacterium soli TaxID=2170551 RepID=A0A328AEU4_9CAUL|nr:M23 family metallopeptidase [Phenylobacterium soli]RAK53169.1 M23 family peptidase [Phenylobacterium soli]